MLTVRKVRTGPSRVEALSSWGRYRQSAARRGSARPWWSSARSV